MLSPVWCASAWLPEGIRDGVLLRVDDSGAIVSLTMMADPPESAIRLDGLVLPGIANAHSHAFHRALRGRASTARTFWSWRTEMYELAARLNPDSYYRLSRAVYGEMVLAGYTCVGEFHYLHHDNGGRRYADPNAMGEALRAAARDAGIRLTLLDTCYLSGGIDVELSAVQRRFADESVTDWAGRLLELAEDANTRIGAAVHSVRAVPSDALSEVGAAVRAHRPLHLHLSEQVAENQACQERHGRSPTALLSEAGVLGPCTTAVHATHVDTADRELLGASDVTACPCPTTEADLADGIGPARELVDAGCRLALGSDQHVVVDPFREAQALEHYARLRSGVRGQFSAFELVRALTEHGYASLGWHGGGRIAVGSLCDLIAVNTESVRTLGSTPEQVPLTAASSDVTAVVVGGQLVVRDGMHTAMGVTEQLREVLLT